MRPPSVERAVLVTGASGFLGRHVLATLGSAARRAVALVRDDAAWRALDWTAALGDVELAIGGLDDVERWEASLPPLAGIAHLAAPVQHSRRASPAMRTVIVEGTLAMVRLAARRRCRLVVASTSGTVGCSRMRGPRPEEDAPFATDTVGGWPYYAAKIEMERRARALADELGVDLVFVRPPILLGPGDHRVRSTRTVNQFLHKRLPFLIRGGMHFADVRDVAAALAAALERPAARPIYHLDGHECGIEEFFDALEDVSGVPRPRAVLPFRAGWLVARALERFHVVPDPVVMEMASHWWGLSSRYAADELGWKPRDPRETLRDTVEWLRENGH
jgi:dihydroflavonol-4-reductase